MAASRERWTLTPTREAQLCLDDAVESVRFDVYLSLARQIPLILHQHGLGQTLAYLQMRGDGRSNSPYQLLYQHLTHWLAMNLGLPEEDVLKSLTRADSEGYVRATQATRLLLLALRTAVEDEILLQQSSGGQQ
jgi:CRISPR/Cas system CMR-associated protein Cmr5 small subunit